MIAANYRDSAFGTPAREPGNAFAFTYFAARPIPRDLEPGANVLASLARADEALARLNSMVTGLADPFSVVEELLLLEALASTRTDGIWVSREEVLRGEAGPAATSEAQREAVQQVIQHVEAAKHAFTLLGDLPIMQRIILGTHAVLVRDLPDPPRWPGDYRTSPVWLGERDATPSNAEFVAPLHDELPALMNDWEHFVNEDGCHYPPMIQAALALYQFETIHPFTVGNGRVGRILVNLLLAERGRLSHPVLTLSTAIEKDRSGYHARLQTVRERGEVEPWLTYFLDNVIRAAETATATALSLGA